jgi:trehalose/maltose hydrolase-like predicted phosphorylase
VADGSTGREETQQQLHLNPKSGRWLPDNTHLQRHVNIAIAYNVWQHYMVTGNIGFLRFAGAELLIEIARFWSSIATYNAELDRYEILGVMGLDEYHESYPDSDERGLRNNTYTNVMAVWVLQRALETLEVLPPHYRQELADEVDGPVQCLQAGRRAHAAVPAVAARAARAVGRPRLRGERRAARPNRLVLPGPHLARIDLSSVVSAWVLVRYRPEEAWRFLRRALDSDVADVQSGTTAEVIHLGAMVGTVDLVLLCLTGRRPAGRSCGSSRRCRRRSRTCASGSTTAATASTSRSPRTR